MSVVEIKGVRTLIVTNDPELETLFEQYAALNVERKALETQAKVLTAQQDQLKAQIRNIQNQKDPETHLKGRLQCKHGNILRSVTISTEWEAIVKAELPELYSRLNTKDFPQYYTQTSKYMVNV